MFKRKKDEPIQYNTLIGMSLEDFYNNNIGLIKHIAFSQDYLNRAEKQGIPFDELYSTGMMGLIHAYRNYKKPEVKLSNYLGKSINFYLRAMFIEEGNTTIKIPYDVRINLAKVKRDKASVDENNKIKLSAEEIAKRFDMSLYNAESVLICEELDNKTKNAYRFEEPQDINKINVSSKIENQKNSVDKFYIQDMLSSLDEREKFIVEKRMEGYNNSEIAKMIGGITRQAIDNIIKRKIQPKMRPVLKKEGFNITKKTPRTKKKKVFYHKNIV